MAEPTKLSSGAHADFSREKSYGDFLCLDELLACQRMLGGSNNESLFIIQHQVSELWMKQVILELEAALACVRADDLPPAFKMLARVSRIMVQLIQAWEVLSTLTASEYMEFRHKLGRSSGFQSFQYRTIEFMLGNKNREMIEPHRHRPEIYDRLRAVLEAPSLYDEASRLLARRGFAIAPEVLDRDFAQPYRKHQSVEDAWVAVYRDTRRWFELYELGEELVDIEDYFRQWRFRHVTTVERVIGFKQGTGGTPGVGYLRKMLEVRLFPELWDLRTVL